MSNSVERGRVTAAVRWWALLTAALIVQATFFGAAAYLNRNQWLTGDNSFYESPAWNLATGHGFTLARSFWDDPYVTGLFRAAHPEWADQKYVPATVFPPGYGYFLAGLYLLVGRSPFAAVLANGGLLLLSILTVAALVRRAFGAGREAVVALALVGSYPMWAYAASWVMSDTLHILLLNLFALTWLVDRPSASRTAAAGVLLGLAALTRPYALLLPLAFGIAYAVFRVRTFSPRNVGLLAVVTWAVFGAWVARNVYYFHRPIVVTMSSGFTLWAASHDRDAVTEAEQVRELRALGVTDPHKVNQGARLQAVALRTIREHPARYVLNCLRRLPRRWVPGDGYGKLPRPVALAVVAYHLVLLAAMVGGMVLLRSTRDPVLAGCGVIVVYFTLVFTPMHVEGRYTLPARAFGLILCAPSLCGLLRGRTSRPGPDDSVPCEAVSGGRVGEQSAVGI